MNLFLHKSEIDHMRKYGSRDTEFFTYEPIPPYMSSTEHIKRIAAKYSEELERLAEK